MYADNIVNNQYIYTETLGRNLNLRRIIHTLPRDTLSNAASEQYVYFCATYDDLTQTDFIYGRLTATLTLDYAFRYGAPNADDIMGDCKLTNDGRYMIATFGTGHYVARTAADIDGTWVYTLGNN